MPDPAATRVRCVHRNAGMTGVVQRSRRGDPRGCPANQNHHPLTAANPSFAKTFPLSRWTGEGWGEGPGRRGAYQPNRPNAPSTQHPHQPPPPLSSHERGASAASGVCPGRRGAYQPKHRNTHVSTHSAPFVARKGRERSELGMPGAERRLPIKPPPSHHRKTPNNQHEIPRIPIQISNSHNIRATIKGEPVRDSAALTSADPPEPSGHRRMCQDRESDDRQETRRRASQRGARLRFPAPKRSLATHRTRSRVG